MFSPNGRSTAIVVAALLLLVGAAFFGLRDAERQGSKNLTQIRASDAVLLGMHSAETEVQAYAEGLDGTRVPYDTARSTLDAAIASAATVGGDDPNILAESQYARRWITVANGAVVRVHTGHLSRLPTTVDQQLDALVGQAASANTAYTTDISHRYSAYLILLRWLFGLIPIALAAMLGVVLRVLGHGERARRRDARGFSETLQVMQTQDETYALVKRYLERVLPRSRVVVLARNNSSDRLEARTDVSDCPELETGLAHATPESCLAVRLGRLREHGPQHEPILGCSVCGELKRAYCVPSLVSGEVIGAVLVAPQRNLPERDRNEIADAVAQAAPVLANLRNLALAENQALTDGLTGLPNGRALTDQLKQAFAQAERTASPLSVIMIDLDHFKKTNDTLGHDKGDELLAAVAATLATTVRASDFAARRSGEEFVVLLPATDQAGAAHLAEHLRSAIAAIKVAGLPQAVSASLGVSTFPGDGPDSDGLLRSADRALYEAKARGRNRVVTTDETRDSSIALPELVIR